MIDILRNGISSEVGSMDVEFVENVIIIPICIVKYVRKSLRESIRNVNAISQVILVILLLLGSMSYDYREDSSQFGRRSIGIKIQ